MSRSDYDVIYAAYSKLTPTELVVFLKARKLPTAGSSSNRASRLANHDLHTYHFPTIQPIEEAENERVESPDPELEHLTTAPLELPIEIIADIMDHVGDWELSTAVGVPTRLARPPDWNRATELDHLILRGNISKVRGHSSSVPTKLGAMMAIRMAYIPILDHILSTYPSLLKDELLPVKASRYGRIQVLSWYKHLFTYWPNLMPPPTPHIISQSIEAASRRGQIASLTWWLADSSIPVTQLHYTESALEHASSRNQIPVLEWWKTNRSRELPLKVGRVMDVASASGAVDALSWWASNPRLMKCAPSGSSNAISNASCNGRIEVLDWWLASGLQFSFDSEVLINATKHDKADVLSWWENSGLVVQYRACDIEEALEDAIGGGERSRKWWTARGLDFTGSDKEWTKIRTLGTKT